MPITRRQVLVCAAYSRMTREASELEGTLSQSVLATTATNSSPLRVPLTARQRATCLCIPYGHSHLGLHGVAVVKDDCYLLHALWRPCGILRSGIVRC